MPNKRSSAALLLEKVNKQLEGERVQSKQQDELAAYLNNLTLRSQRVRHIDVQQNEDISTSSAADTKNSSSFVGHRSISPAFPTPASRFLKKKPAPDLTAPCQARTATEVDASIKSGKVTGRHQQVFRDSQSEISITGSDLGQRTDSAESGLGREALQFLKSKNSQDQDRKTTLRSSIAQPASQEKQLEQSNDDIARTLGNHFVPSDQDSLTEFVQGLSTSELSARRPQNLVTKKQQKWRKRTSSSASHSPSPVLESRPQSPLRRSRSPFGKLSQSASQDSDVMNSMVSEMLHERPDSDISDQHFKINLMDVISLLPSSPSPPSLLPPGQQKMENTDFKNLTQKHKRSSVMSPSILELHNKQKLVSSKLRSAKTKQSSSSLLDVLGIHMADELLNMGADSSAAERLDISEESEIKTQSSNEHKIMMERHKSESSIITDIGGEQMRAWSVKQDPLRASARQTSNNIDSTDVDEYSDSFHSESFTRTPNMSQGSRDNRPRSHSTKKQSKRSQNHKLVMEELLVDVSTTDAKGSTRRWKTTQTDIQTDLYTDIQTDLYTDIHVGGMSGLHYKDPNPVAMHVVSADTLQAVTTYNPNMLALHEMMKVQLQLVQNFVAIQQRIYQSCMDGFKDDYKYTTLEDTREYIRRNQKPGLTFKEALQLVE